MQLKHSLLWTLQLSCHSMSAKDGSRERYLVNGRARTGLLTLKSVF